MKRFYCQRCEKILTSGEVIIKVEGIICKKCGYNAVHYNFSDDKKEYSIKDPYNVAILQCLGVEIIKRDASDPRNIVFTLRHDKIVEYVNAIYDGDLGKYAEILRLDKFVEYHKAIMKYIREIKFNAKVRG